MKPVSRRTFLRTSSAAVLLAGGQTVRAAEAARPRAPFRVLYNNDTTNTVSCTSPWHKKRAPFGPELLEATVDEVADTGVEVHLLQPGLGWIPWWKSTVYPADEHYRWFAKQTGLKPDSYGQYMLAGGDMAAVFIERCRRRGQVPFISLRMNDAHNLENVGQRNNGAAAASKFYVEHPEYRLGPDQSRSDQHVLNWAIAEVREQKFRFIQELCENYDLDGLEMDFMRYPAFFQLDKTDRDQRCKIMTDFVAQVRGVLDRTTRNGRRRWLCARVPCYLEALDPLGLDLPAMVAAGLDILTVSAFYFTVQQTALPVIRRMVPDAAVYLELCHATANGKRPPGPGYDIAPFRRTTPEQFYTAAHLAYSRGADGVSAFNFAYYREHGGPGRGPFAEPPFHVFKHLGDRAWLARQPQHYFLATGWLNPFVKPAPLPCAVDAGKPTSFTLDLAPPAGGWTQGGRLRIQCELPQDQSQWNASLNGQPLSSCEDVSEPYANPYPPMLGRPEELRAWTVPASLLQDGPNRIDLTLAQGTKARIAFLDLGVC